LEGFVVAVVPFCFWSFLFYTLELAVGFGELAVVNELEVACDLGLGYGHLAAPFTLVFFSFLYAVGGDFKDAFAVGEVRARNEAGDTDGSAAGFAEVYASVACVSYYVAAYGVDGVAEEDIGFCHDLVSDDCGGVEGTSKANKFVHVFVELLLAKGEGFSAYVFASEVRGEAVDDDEADVVFFYDFVGVF